MFETIAEVFLRPIFEIFSVLTAMIIVPLCTLGFVRVAFSSEEMTKSVIKKGHFYIIDSDWARIIGAVFWCVVLILIFIR